MKRFLLAASILTAATLTPAHAETFNPKTLAQCAGHTWGVYKLDGTKNQNYKAIAQDLENWAAETYGRKEAQRLAHNAMEWWGRMAVNNPKRAERAIEGCRGYIEALVKTKDAPETATEAPPKAAPATAAYTIPLAMIGGSWYMEASINGVPQAFILDSGAATVSLTTSSFNEVRKKGGVRFSREATFTLADGSTRVKSLWIVDTLVLGKYTFRDVEVSETSDGADQLFGTTILNRFSSWSVDTITGRLALN